MSSPRPDPDVVQALLSAIQRWAAEQDKKMPTGAAENQPGEQKREYIHEYTTTD